MALAEPEQPLLPPEVDLAVFVATAIAVYHRTRCFIKVESGVDF